MLNLLALQCRVQPNQAVLWHNINVVTQARMPRPNTTSTPGVDGYSITQAVTRFGRDQITEHKRNGT
jgi:hypothetical protein